ncbi:MAG: ZipA [Thauera phenolivorans]|uniref:Cell division protein ZipA n=1 Tax=Thauera phenolivorans TaxID=1792543 RepID=A0A7X7LWB1_9RHOO|nr:ZipA [Thauera phenolivorans]
MDSDLQIALVGAGLGLVVLIVAYNKWQEHKHKQRAEAFRSEGRDVLLERRSGAGAQERNEPRFGDGEDEEAVAGVGASGAAPSAARPVREAPTRRSAPEVPEVLDARADCIVRLEAIEPLEAQRVWHAQSQQLAGLPVRWFALDETSNQWRGLDAHSAGACHWYCAAMQLVNRQGAIGEAEFQHFSGGVQRVADALMALPAELPLRTDTLQKAAALDRFCAEVDVQVGVNVVATGAPFEGSRIHEAASAQGMTLQGDGTYHARDVDGNTLFTVGNLEPSLFAADMMKQVRTGGLTLVIDVPRVSEGPVAFDLLMQAAGRLANALGGAVVDDNRTLFGAEAADMVRGQIAQFQERMDEHGIPAGSPLAKRLFAI